MKTSLNYYKYSALVLSLACCLGTMSAHADVTNAQTKTVNMTAKATGAQPAGASFSLPAYQTVVLDNGLTINLMVQKEVPLITMNAVVKVGAVNDTISGIANITAQSLMLGAGGQTKAEIEQNVDFLGAQLASYAGLEGSYVNADFMSKDLDKMLPIFTDVLRSPDFESTEFKKLIKREVAGLSQQKESPKTVIGRYFNKFVFGSHPYANPDSGNSDTIATLNVDKLRAFHQQYYQPSNIALNVVGDFDVAEMTKKLNGHFADWKNQKSAEKIDLLANLPKLNTSRVLLVDKPDAIETTFLIGGMGISYDSPDYVGLTVVNTILGGRFTSWLNDELRVNAGLTYGARSNFDTFSNAGTFQISTFTKSETTKEAIDLALKTYARLWEKGVDQVTLDSAKAYVKGQFPPKFETSGQLAALMSDMYLYGFNDDFINQFQAKVDGLTVAETQRLVKAHFPKSNYQLVLIGNADKIADIAANYGEVTRINITDTGFGG